MGGAIGHGMANSRVRAFKRDYEHTAVFRQNMDLKTVIITHMM
jgi:hypothetical protein